MYSLLSNRHADFYPDVNTTSISLAAMEKEFVLTVTLHTRAPNFKTFEVNIDGEGWNEVSKSFRWKLNRGANRLGVRSLNTFGRFGPVSSAKVFMQGEGN